MQIGGYSGIVNISPFACLIGRVIEGLFAPWARDRNYPTISVEVDGNQLPPNIVNKLNIFMVNVLRFKGGRDLSSLIEPPEGNLAAKLILEHGIATSCSSCGDTEVAACADCVGCCGQ